MSKRTVGLILLLLGSIVIGYGAGQYFFKLFDRTVPQGSMTDLVRAGTHGAYLMGGFLLGVVIFVWSVLVAFLAGYFPHSAKSGPSA